MKTILLLDIYVSVLLYIPFKEIIYSNVPNFNNVSKLYTKITIILSFFLKKDGIIGLTFWFGIIKATLNFLNGTPYFPLLYSYI